MRASEFEFRYRFWIFGLIFWVAFASYSFDHVNAGVALLRRLVGPGLDLNSAGGRHALQAVYGAAAALTILAALVRTWGSAYLQSDVVHDADLRSEALVADGPYRYVRNPLYFGNMLLAAGIGMMASRTGWFVLFIGIFLYHYRLIGREESELLKTQGERYRAYLAAVPRLLPALRPRTASGGMKPQWKQAFAGEAFMWTFAAVSLAYAVTLRLSVVYFLFLIALIGYVVRMIARRRQQPASRR